MTAITDLSFQNLADAATAKGLPSSAFSVVSNKVVIDVTSILGTTAADLTAKGVIDFIIKLRELCVGAQITVNANQNIGERLAAFPTLSYGTLGATGDVQVQGAVIGKLNVSTQNLHAIGVNN